MCQRRRDTVKVLELAKSFGYLLINSLGTFNVNGVKDNIENRAIDLTLSICYFPLPAGMDTYKYFERAGYFFQCRQTPNTASYKKYKNM